MNVVLLYFVLVDTSEKLPLMEGEGKYLRVLGFNQNQRGVFVQILMRYHWLSTSLDLLVPSLPSRASRAVFTQDKYADSLFLRWRINKISDFFSYRFGVGEYDWAEFVPRLKQKTYEEINEYVVGNFDLFSTFTFNIFVEAVCVFICLKRKEKRVRWPY